MSDVAIRVENLGKCYRLGEIEPYKTLRDAIAQAISLPGRRLRRVTFGARNHTIWAIRDVSFEVKPGEVLGIIGRNGAGKSTLLKILSRITAPTEGGFELYGRVGSLLEVGTGFHPELTGRENVYLNGVILGMSKGEIDGKFDAIIDFAGVENFIDTPVKRYSSGMWVRLAFAIAAHLEPEILIVDEVLTVGDVAFQRKCLGTIGDVAKQGQTVLLVSHQMPAVQALCSKVVHLKEGRVIKIGDPASLVADYLNDDARRGIEVDLSQRTDRTGSGVIRFTAVRVQRADGSPISVATSGQDVTFVFEYECPTGGIPRNVDVGFSLEDGDGRLLFVLYSSYMGMVFSNLERRGEFRCTVCSLPVAPGTYIVGARILEGQVEADWPRDGVAKLVVEAGDFYRTGSRGFGSRAPMLVKGVWNSTSTSRTACAPPQPTSESAV